MVPKRVCRRVYVFLLRVGRRQFGWWCRCAVDSQQRVLVVAMAAEHDNANAIDNDNYEC